MKISAIRLLMFAGLLLNTQIIFAQQEKIVLKSVVLDQDAMGISKYYFYDKPLDVSYFYGENIMDGEWSNVLRLTLEQKPEGVWIPLDIEKAGFIVGGDGNSTVNKFKLPNAQLPEYCSLAGSAKVILTDMAVWVPEFPTSYESSAKVVDVISVSRPKLECSE